MCAYIEYCDILHYVFVIYDVYYFEPEGPPELWDRRVPLRHIDQRVLSEYSHERLLRYVWYFEELTKICAYRVMCYVFQVFSGSRDGTDSIVHTRGSVCFEDPSLLIE